jgi:alpha-beta hydrolase superfamily lysophospholipase
MTFGYNSQVWITPFNHATSERLFTFGEELMNALRDHRIEPHQQCRPLILVGHSLGGLVIKSVSTCDIPLTEGNL